MKKIKSVVIQFGLCIVLIFSQYVAQSQNSITISSSGLPENPTDIIGPGNPISVVTDDTKWLNYNILLDPYDSPVSITVEIASGPLPDGLQLQIQAGTYQGGGGSSSGTPMGKIMLSNQPQVLIENIETCNSGIGPYLGHQLTYTYTISDYTISFASLSTIQVLFTINQTAMGFNRNIPVRQQSRPVRVAASTR